MSANLECVGQGYKSYKILYFKYYMADFNNMFTRVIDMQPAIKLLHQLSLEVYVSVTVHKMAKKPLV